MDLEDLNWLGPSALRVTPTEEDSVNAMFALAFLAEPISGFPDSTAALRLVIAGDSLDMGVIDRGSGGAGTRWENRSAGFSLTFDRSTPLVIRTRVIEADTTSFYLETEFTIPEGGGGPAIRAEWSCWFEYVVALGYSGAAIAFYRAGNTGGAMLAGTALAKQIHTLDELGCTSYLRSLLSSINGFNEDLADRTRNQAEPWYWRTPLRAP